MPDHPINTDIRLVDGEFYAADPHAAFTWMREKAPIYFDAAGDCWGIALHEDVMRVSKTPALFCNRHGMRPDAPAIPSMINMDDPQHKLRRGLVNRGFTPRRVSEHEKKIRSVCRRLIDRVASRGECDFVKEVAAPLPMIMIGELLGVDEKDHDRLLRWSDNLIEGTSISAGPEKLQAALAAFQEYSEYNRAVVADRRANPRDDLMSVLVHGEVNGEKLGDEDLIQEGLLILVGGDETTRHVISGGMERLLRNPEQLQILVDDPSKIPLAVEEMLRWVTPIQNMARTVTEDTELRGQKLREGDKVLLLYGSANRDERVFEDPFCFDVTRDPNDHVAFGGYGAHFCLGASLARLELRVMFEELLTLLKGFELVADEPLRLRPSNFIVGLEEMRIRFEAS